MTEKNIDSYIKFGELADSYGNVYNKINLEEEYPANAFRLKIFLDLLGKCKPEKTIDVGCGTGDPMIAMLKAGHDVVGFDYAEDMVQKAKDNLSASGFDTGKVLQDNMEDIANFQPLSFDCAVALGSVYYARDFDKTFDSVCNLIKPGGDLIFSLRNDLFSLFSVNKYSLEFFVRNFIDTEKISEEEKKGVSAYLANKFLDNEQEKAFFNVDDMGIHSTMHNPLTVEETILKPRSLSLEGIYYYHFHALPPIFEHKDKVRFREMSMELENPTDWRGTFSASAFVVHAKKSS